VVEESSYHSPRVSLLNTSMTPEYTTVSRKRRGPLERHRPCSILWGAQNHYFRDAPDVIGKPLLRPRLPGREIPGKRVRVVGLAHARQNGRRSGRPQSAALQAGSES
jgi:hypothetical protein